MGAKILIADDNPNVLRLLNISLTKANEDYEIVQAENGEIAFQLANEEKPDLIISDVMMPKMDGIELCWMIRENSKVPLVPFIFLTSFGDQETTVRGFRAGADDYLTKPVDRKKLLETVHDLLNRKKNLENLGGKTETSKGFSGDLQDLSIVELVQMLNFNKKSGVLTITNDGQGFVYINQGNLWAVRKGDLNGEEAFYEIVKLKQGAFSFEVSDVTVEQNIHNSTMNVLMEACRVTDEENNKE